MKKLPEEQKVGFYGLDVYSLWEVDGVSYQDISREYDP